MVLACEVLDGMGEWVGGVARGWMGRLDGGDSRLRHQVDLVRRFTSPIFTEPFGPFAITPSSLEDGVKARGNNTSSTTVVAINS